HVDPISSVVSAGHTLGLRGGSDSDRSRRITILDAITQGRGWVEPRTITFVCSVSYRESRARERSCGEGEKHYPRRLQHFGFYLVEAASLDLLDSWGVMETTLYSRSFWSRSSTCNSILSFWMRNWARSPTGRSTGCLSSRGRMRSITCSLSTRYSGQSNPRLLLFLE